MQSYRFEQFGSLDYLALHQEEMPVPQAREVLVRIRATSLNYRDMAIMQAREAWQYFDSRQHVGKVVISH